MREVGVLLQRLARENAEFLRQRDGLAAQLEEVCAERDAGLRYVQCWGGGSRRMQGGGVAAGVLG